ncbi:MAG TPA: oxygen-dependent coproporphyrinogen oxidase [Anaeromyxobacteraceae bacterium]|nr:oxygen-dependent coproporphyrinogen oxidase [Anaeromyxobacteraceae bacterium]
MPFTLPEEELAELRGEMSRFVRARQAEICDALERADGAGRFSSDAWDRAGGGGGLSRVMQDGAIFEKAGVSVSEVHGALDPAFARRLGGGEAPEFHAVGLSLVLHPRSPRVPTVHLNVRLIQRGASAWFGGGADLTPYYLEEDDARHFHGVLRDVCDRHALEPDAYARFKRAADAYFFLKHRGEHRGVGGIFFEDPKGAPAAQLAFVTDVARAFLPAYLPIVERRRALPWGEPERRWQEIRRGRYVEFNLVLDRGTVFGLETGARTESILMSLPPRVRWVYDHRPEPGSAEAALLDVLRSPREWA